MPNGTTQHLVHTTVGDLIAACYQAALNEVGDEELARRITSAIVSDVTSRAHRRRVGN